MYYLLRVLERNPEILPGHAEEDLDLVIMKILQYFDYIGIGYSPRVVP